MSEIKNTSQVVQDAKKPYMYEGNDMNIKNVLSQINTNTNTQRQILKKLEEESTNHSKLEKTLLAVKNDLKEIMKSTQNNNVNQKRDSDFVKQIKTKISDIQTQLKEVSNGIATINLPKQKNKNKEEEKKAKELKREEKKKAKELKREEKKKAKELKRENKKNTKKNNNKMKKGIKK